MNDNAHRPNVADPPLVIDSVTGASGEISNGSTTADRVLTFKGTGKPDAVLHINNNQGIYAYVLADKNGEWQLTDKDLLSGPHVIQAWSADNGERSEPWALTVSAVPPSIGSVSSSSGDIHDGDMTEESALTLTGESDPYLGVDLYDSDQLIATTRADHESHWQIPLTQLPVGAHRLTAKSANGLTSAPFNFTRQISSIPRITRLASSEADVPQDGATRDTALSLHGTADKNSKVRVINAEIVLQEVDADSGGNWQYLLKELAIDTYSITASTASGLTSPPWGFTVLPSAQTPTITDIANSAESLDDFAVSQETAVVIIGKASPDSMVELFDNNISIGSRPASATGIWQTTLTHLSSGLHSFLAVSDGMQSLARSIVVQPPVQALYPHRSHPPQQDANKMKRNQQQRQEPVIKITGVVTDGGQSIPDGGITSETSVTFSGVGQPGSEVQLLDNGVDGWRPGSVDQSGFWEVRASPIFIGAHNITALDGSNPPSNTWRLRVSQPATQPDITEVFDNAGRVEEGGTTSDSTLTVKGFAAPETDIELLVDQGSPSRGKSNDSGFWTVENFVLPHVEGPHRIEVRNLNGAVSDSWLIVLRFATSRPIIYRVFGAGDEVEQDVENGGVTSQTQLEVHGTGEVGSIISLWDNDFLIYEWLPVNESFFWRADPHKFAEGAHRLTALSNSVSEPGLFTFTIQSTAPTLDDVADNNGSIPAGGDTDQTSLSMRGRTMGASQLELVDNGTLNPAPVSIFGDEWGALADGFSIGAHEVFVRTPSGLKSNTWTFNVIESYAFEITRIVGRSGEVPDNGNTYDHDLTIHGTGKPNTLVTLSLNGLDITGIEVDGNGKWQHLQRDLESKGYEIQATDEELNTTRGWFVTVLDLIAPFIERVSTIDNDNLEEGGITAETAVTLHGIAQPLVELRVYDEGTPRTETVEAEQNGTWAVLLTGLTFAPHSMTVRDASQQTSNARTFTVVHEKKPRRR